MKKSLVLLFAFIALTFSAGAMAQTSGLTYLNQLAHPGINDPSQCQPGHDNYNDTCAQFCSLFTQETESKCGSLPMCSDMSKIYAAMIGLYGSVQNACKAKALPGEVQNCIDAWNCYNNGGQDSQGKECSGTGAKC